MTAMAVLRAVWLVDAGVGVAGAATTREGEGLEVGEGDWVRLVVVEGLGTGVVEDVTVGDPVATSPFGRQYLHVADVCVGWGGWRVWGVCCCRGICARDVNG
jgi:hypothetical protein